LAGADSEIFVLAKDDDNDSFFSAALFLASAFLGALLLGKDAVGETVEVGDEDALAALVVDTDKEEPCLETDSDG
jgi:hypothetical protein